MWKSFVRSYRIRTFAPSMADSLDVDDMKGTSTDIQKKFGFSHSLLVHLVQKDVFLPERSLTGVRLAAGSHVEEGPLALLGLRS